MQWWMGVLLVLGGVSLAVMFVGNRIAGAGDGSYGNVEAYVGRPGQGKTTLAVQDVIRRADMIAGLGRPVVIVSNIVVSSRHEAVLLRQGWDGIDMEPLLETCFRMREAGGAVVLLIDEASIALPARFWQTFGVAMMWVLQQSRKLYVELRYTSQAITMVDVQLRDVTAATHGCKAHPPATVVRRLQGFRPWYVNMTTWDATDVGTEARYLGSRRVWYARERAGWRLPWARRGGFRSPVLWRYPWEGSYNTDVMLLPPAKLKGSTELRDLLEKLGMVVLDGRVELGARSAESEGQDVDADDETSEAA